MCAHRGKIEMEARRRQRGECWRLIKGVIVLRLIAAHLHPELAEVRTPTSAAEPAPSLSHDDPRAS